jgi:hypothetical protein
MGTSKYWKFNFQKKPITQEELNKLKKERDRLSKEIEGLRERDILKAEIKRSKTEKFYRSPSGKLALTLRQAGGTLAHNWQTSAPERKKLGKELLNLYKKL